MSLLRSFPPLAFALVLLSIVGICAAQRSVGLLLVAGTLAALSWSITEGPRGRTLPRWVSNILVIGVCLNVFRDLSQNMSDVMGVLGRFTLLLTLVKLYERRTARDHAQLLMLSMVLMVAGCMQSSDLIFGIVLLLYVALGLYVLLLYQLHAAHEHAREARAAAAPDGYRLLPPAKPILGRHAGLHFRLMAVGVAIAGVALSIGVFVGFPRGIGSDLLGALSAPALNRTGGFTWDVNLTSGDRINRSTARVFTLQLLDGETPVEIDGPLLLRGAVLDRYEGRGLWTGPEAMTRRFRMTANRYERVSLGGIDPGRTITQRFTFVRAMSGEVPLFSMYAPVGVTTDSSVEIRYDPRRQSLRTVGDTRRIVGYSVRAQPQPTLNTQRGLTDLIKPLGRVGWFRDDDGRVGATARALLAEAGLPTEAPSLDREDPRFLYSDAWTWNRQAAQVFTDHLHSAEFTYTLDLSDLRLRDEDDPITAFLVTGKRGHCEYFASALAAMCHSVDIPARVISGFIAQEYDSAAQHYSVLEGNAHAWTEVATGPHLWATFDPTAPASLPRLTIDSGAFADTMRSVYSRFEGNWSAGVVGFDDSTQGRLIDQVGQGWTKRITAWLDAVRDGMERVNIFFNVGPGGYIWMGIVATALVIAVIALIRLLRRSATIRRTLQLEHVRGREYRRMLQQLGFYLDMLAVLRRGGVGKPEWQPPLNHAEALASTHPEPAGLVRDITVAFYEARYGRRALDSARLQQVRAQLKRLAAALRVRA